MRDVRFLLSTLLLLFVSGNAAFASSAVDLDLHSHFWIKEGTTLILRGDFDEPTRSKSASSLLQSKIARDSLDASGLRMVVVSLYAHPILAHFRSGSALFDFSRDTVQESLLRQIERAEKFVAENPNWMIASEPSEAREALAAGRRVIVLSLETAEGALDTESDRALFIDRKKISIVTLMHLTPDRIGRGVALMTGTGVLNAPGEWLASFLVKTTDPESGAYVNGNGLSAFGKTVLESLIQHRVWIDLSHSSDVAQREIFTVLDRVGQPSLYTHTKLREFAKSERGVANFELERVKKTGGIVGLVPTEDLTRPLPDREFPLSAECRTGISAYSEEWKRTVKLLGAPAAVALGSDFNAPLRGLSGKCLPKTPVAAAYALADGFYRAEQLPALFENLRANGVDFGNDPNARIERFLTAWEKIRKPSAKGARGKVPPPKSERARR